MSEIIFEFPDAPQIDFLTDLQGESLYQIWLSLGNTGDHAAFLDWLRQSGVGGTLNVGYIPKATGNKTIGNSSLYESNGNIGLNTTTPLSAGGASKWITLNGNAGTYSGGNIYAIGGVAKAYSYVDSDGLFTHQAGLGIGQKFLANSQEVMRITLSGNVGIGTAIPLTAGGDWRGLNIDGARASLVLSNNGINPSYIYTSGATGSDLTIENAANQIYVTNGLERMRITPSGNVGIGTTLPIAKHHIDDNNWALSNVTISRLSQKYLGGANDYEQHVILLHPIYNGTNIDFNKCSGTIFATRGGTSMGLINDTYNVNTSSAYSSIIGSVNGVNGFGRLFTCLYGGVKYLALVPDYRTSAVQYNFDGYIRSTNEMLKVVPYRNSSNGTVLNSEVYNSLTLFNANMTYFHGDLYSNNNMCIGGASGVGKLQVWGVDNTSANYSLQTYNNSGFWLFGVRNDGMVNFGIWGNAPYNVTTAAAANAFLNSNGEMYRSTSSLKYKTSVKNYNKGLAEILKMRPVYYRGKNDGKKLYAGLIAEEIHDLGLTEFVQYADDNTPDALHYANMIALLVNGIKELKNDVDALKVN